MVPRFRGPAGGRRGCSRPGRTAGGGSGQATN